MATQLRLFDKEFKLQVLREIDAGIDELQADLDAWLESYNNERPHQGRWCYGKTPMQTFTDSIELAKEKTSCGVTSCEALII